VNGEFELLAKVLGEEMNFLCLDSFLTGHAKGQSDYDFLHVVLANQFVEMMEIVFAILSVQGIESLRSDPERVGNGNSDTAGTNIEAKDTVGSFHVANYRVKTD